jgi:hypothetical protein
MNGVFEIVRVVRRGLISIAEVHAIVAGAHLAQSEPEMARDRFGFLEPHRLPFVARRQGSCAIGCVMLVSFRRAQNNRRCLSFPPYNPLVFSAMYSSSVVRTDGGSFGADNMRSMIDTESPEAL